MTSKQIKIIIALLIWLFPAISVFAFSANVDSLGTVSGIVYDTSMWTNGKMIENPVTNAIIRLSEGRDTVYTTSSRNGSFACNNIRPGRVKVHISEFGYDPYDAVMIVVPGKNMILVELKIHREELGYAKITADVPPVVHKGDTVIFNAAAVSTTEGDNAIEILRQMPGVSFENGKIKINGEEVKRTYVNGKLIFGDDAMNPLTAILADNVRTIQSYKELGADDVRRGAKNGIKERVMNITTNKKIVSAFDGHLVAGGGADGNKNTDGKIQGRFATGITANFYSEMFLAYANANTNNIGRTTNTLTSLMSSPGILNFYKEDATFNTGVKKYWGDRFLGSNASLDYSYTHNHGRSSTRTLTDYLASEGSPARSYADTTGSCSSSGTHHLNFNLDLNNHKLKSIYILSLLDITNSVNKSLDNALTSVYEGTTARQNASSSDKNNSWSWDNYVKWSNNEKTKGLIPSLAMNFSLGNSDGNSWTLDTLASSATRRYITSSKTGKNYSLGGTASSTIYLSNTERSTSSITFGYNVSFSSEKRRQTAFDLLDVSEPVINAANTFDYTWNGFSNGPSIMFNGSFSHSNWSIGSAFNPDFTKQIDTERYPEKTNGSRWFFRPLAFFTIKHKNFSFVYNTLPIIPAVEQYRNRINDSNPLYLSAGNPDLKECIKHILGANYFIPKAGKYGTLTSAINLSFTPNAIVRKTLYFPSDTHIDGWGGYDVKAGSSLTTYDNASGTFNIGCSFTYTLRLQKIKTLMHIVTSYGYDRKPQWTSGQLIHLKEETPDLQLGFSTRPNKNLSFRIDGDAMYTDSRNDQSQVLAKLWTLNGRASASVTFLKHGFIKTGYNWSGYKFIEGAGKNTNFQNLNAAIGARLMKGRLLISLSGDDLLDKGSAYSIMNESNYTTQTWTPSYGRYFMLNIGFRLNRMKSPVEFRGGLQELDDESSRRVHR